MSLAPPSPTAQRSARSAALLVVAGVLWVLALPSRSGPTQPCDSPRAVAARGALAAVRCDDRAGAAPAGAERLLFGLPLDVNRSGAAAFEALPGIGAGRAAAIVLERSRRAFCTVAELDRVAGLGPATLARIEAFLAAPDAPGCAGS